MKTLGRAQILAGATALLLALPVAAAQFPVTGTVAFGSETSALPTGTNFGDSTWNPATGELSSGRFHFPRASISRDTDLGPLKITYDLTQTSDSMALVDADGNAAFTTVALQLHVVSVTLGYLPLDIGPACDFAPLLWDDLAGTASAAGMEVAQASFGVPETSGCGAWRDQINDAIAAADGSVELELAGDFTPPSGDLIFSDGFETP